jgi:hypothetical protein
MRIESITVSAGRSANIARTRRTVMQMASDTWSARPLLIVGICTRAVAACC